MNVGDIFEAEGQRFRVLNPEWPSGDAPFCELADDEEPADANSASRAMSFVSTMNSRTLGGEVYVAVCGPDGTIIAWAREDSAEQIAHALNEVSVVTGRFLIRNGVRSGQQYRAELHLDGRVVGHVERAFSSGGYRASEYVAWIAGTRVAYARTLAELRADLCDPAIWRTPRR